MFLSTTVINNYYFKKANTTNFFKNIVLVEVTGDTCVHEDLIAFPFCNTSFFLFVCCAASCIYLMVKLFTGLQENNKTKNQNKRFKNYELNLSKEIVTVFPLYALRLAIPVFICVFSCSHFLL